MTVGVIVGDNDRSCFVFFHEKRGLEARAAVMRRGPLCGPQRQSTELVNQNSYFSVTCTAHCDSPLAWRVVMAATGWQQHSVRGFLAGVVRKKLGLNLVSEPSESGRVYRIIDDMASPAKANQVKQAA